MTSEVLKKDFLDQFFPMEKSEAKVVEFINLNQEGVGLCMNTH